MIRWRTVSITTRSLRWSSRLGSVISVCPEAGLAARARPVQAEVDVVLVRLGAVRFDQPALAVALVAHSVPAPSASSVGQPDTAVENDLLQTHPAGERIGTSERVLRRQAADEGLRRLALPRDPGVQAPVERTALGV